MRTKKSLNNIAVAFLSNFITIIIGFVSQIFFVRYLGKEYLGLNGLFLNIVSMLGIVEMGLGNALIFHLYEPISKNNRTKIKSLMSFYKKSYHLIAFIILLLGLCIMPFLNYFVNTSLNTNIYLIFFLFIIETVCSYLLSYKRSIIYANQENYIINLIKLIYILFLNISQIIILIITKNYYLFLVLKIIFRLLENLLITIYANKKYSYINEKNVKSVDKKTKKDIVKKVKGLFFHKIGTYIVMGTDNIIISKFIGLVTVGIFSNYIMIINGIKNLFSQVFYSITASIGNLLVEKDYKKSFKIYKNMLFGNFWLASFSSVSFFIISESFMTIWLGKDFILNKYIVFALMLQLYLDIYGYTIGAFKNAAGIYHEDRFIPIFQSILNIIFSIILVKKYDLIGVIIGTIISYMLLYIYSYPKYTYKNIFKKKYMEYLIEFFKHLILFLIIFMVTLCLYYILKFNSVWLQFIYSVILCTIIPNLLIIIIYKKTDEFLYMKNLIKNKIIKKHN